MVRLIIVSLILFKCILASYCQQYDSAILCEQIAGKKSTITDILNSTDSLYRVVWQEFYDLEGTHKVGASNMTLIIYTKKNEIIRVAYIYDEKTNFEKTTIQQQDISTLDKLRIDSIVSHEYARGLKWRQQMNVPAVIKKRAQCTLNGLEYAGVIGLSFYYDVVPIKNSFNDTHQ